MANMTTIEETKPTVTLLPKFENGWFCKTCGCITEHQKVCGQQVCVICGCRPNGEKPVSYFQRPDIKAKKRAYDQRPDVKARRQERYREKQLERLKAKLAKSTMGRPVDKFFGGKT